MSDLTFGSEYSMSQYNINNSSVFALDDTRFFISYMDYSDYQIKAVVGTINDNVITTGSAYIPSTSIGSPVSSCVIDSNHVIIAVNDVGETYIKNIYMLDINGIDINIATGTSVQDYSYGVDAMHKIDNNHVLIIYDKYVSILTFNGTSMTQLGNFYAFTSTSKSYYRDVGIIDNTHALIAYSDDSLNMGCIKIATISGESITFSSEYIFNASPTSYIKITPIMNSNCALIMFKDTSGGCCVIATINGEEISFSAKYVFEISSITNGEILRIDNTHALVLYQKNNSPYNSIAIIATLNNNSIDYSLKYEFNPSDSTVSGNKMCGDMMINVNKTIIGYNESSKLKLIVGNINLTTLILSAIQNGNHIDLSWALA